MNLNPSHSKLALCDQWAVGKVEDSKVKHHGLKLAGQPRKQLIYCIVNRLNYFFPQLWVTENSLLPCCSWSAEPLSKPYGLQWELRHPAYMYTPYAGTEIWTTDIAGCSPP